MQGLWLLQLPQNSFQKYCFIPLALLPQKIHHHLDLTKQRCTSLLLGNYCGGHYLSAGNSYLRVSDAVSNISCWNTHPVLKGTILVCLKRIKPLSCIKQGKPKEITETTKIGLRTGNCSLLITVRILWTHQLQEMYLGKNPEWWRFCEMRA